METLPHFIFSWNQFPTEAYQSSVGVWEEGSESARVCGLLDE